MYTNCNRCLLFYGRRVNVQVCQMNDILEITENGTENDQEDGISTHIKFEISAEPYDPDDEGFIPKAVGTIKGATVGAVRMALGTVIGMFLEKRMRDNDRG